MVAAAVDPIPDSVWEPLCEILRHRAASMAPKAVAAGMEPDDLFQFGALAAWVAWPRREPDAADRQLVAWLYARGAGEMESAVRERGRYKRGHLARVLSGAGPRFVEAHAANGRRTDGYQDYRGRTTLDTVADPKAADPAVLADDPAGLFRSAVRSAVGAVSPAEYEVLAGCYLRGELLREVGAAMGLSESRASQIRTDVIRRARESAGVS